MSTTGLTKRVIGSLDYRVVQAISVPYFPQ